MLGIEKGAWNLLHEEHLSGWEVPGLAKGR